MPKDERISCPSLNSKHIAQIIDNSLENCGRGSNQEIALKISWLLSLSTNEFIVAVYKVMLNRKPDEPGMEHYLELLCAGMPKEGVIYDIYCSNEFGHRFLIDNIKKFEAARTTFYNKTSHLDESKTRWLKKLKKINCIPAKLENILSDINHREAKQRVREIHLKNEISDLQKKTDLLLDALRKLQDSNDILLNRFKILESYYNDLRQQNNSTLNSLNTPDGLL